MRLDSDGSIGLDGLETSGVEDLMGLDHDEA